MSGSTKAALRKENELLSTRLRQTQDDLWAAQDDLRDTIRQLRQLKQTQQQLRQALVEAEDAAYEVSAEFAAQLFNAALGDQRSALLASVLDRCHIRYAAENAAQNAEPEPEPEPT